MMTVIRELGALGDQKGAMKWVPVEDVVVQDKRAEANQEPQNAGDVTSLRFNPATSSLWIHNSQIINRIPTASFGSTGWLQTC